MTKLVVILGFVFSFAAGLVIGTRSRLPVLSPAVSAPTTAPAGSERRGPGGWLTTELGLTSEQRAKLDTIWSALASNGRGELYEKRRQYREERDTAVAGLVPPSRKEEYDKIVFAYVDRAGSLERASKDAYESAVEQTKQILTPEQRTWYEEMLSRNRWGRGMGADLYGNRRSETRATSQPDRADPTAPSQLNTKGAP